MDAADGEVDLVERLPVDLEAELEGFHLEYQTEAAAARIGPGTGNRWWPWPNQRSTQAAQTWRWRPSRRPTNRRDPISRLHDVVGGGPADWGA